ncbi:virulence factor BrkB family protein [Halopseudomonas pelagia]|uniref:virulence factor BrkB family protein n=1 Tax=Halopseudomonas pelagia TaxID=553151 RepID=UPI00039CD39C|nr:virulence factor BrkB family protein [Halopseudomonas pelagia]|tara:strand:- start:69493 stop:70764 length:1272 start_codon:yes stop_codon:yes gene_type:complete
MPHRLNLLLHFFRYLFRRFGEDNCAKNAAALTYTTLFAVVPVMTVTYAMLAAIPAFHQVGGQIEDFIFNNFVPATGDTLREYLQDFSDQARQLTGIGIALLVITAFMMLVNIERSFNAIWRIRQRRRGVSSFLLYWAVLSLGPLLLGAGFLVSTYLTSLNFLAGDAAVGDAYRWLLGWVPLLLSVAAFTLVFVAVPNTRVPFRHGLVGGILVALLFEGAKASFALYVALFPGYQLIYGAFAAFPLFLIWVYISWLIILFGAELVANLDSSSAWQRPLLPRLVTLMALLRVLLQAQQKGQTVDLGRVNAAGWVMHEELWLQLTELLESEQIITRAQQGGYVLSRDLDGLDMADLLSRLPEPLPAVATLPERVEGDGAWYPPFLQALGRLEEQRKQVLQGSVKNWLGPDAGSAVTAPLETEQLNA